MGPGFGFALLAHLKLISSDPVIDFTGNCGANATGPEVTKKIYILSSAEHEIYTRNLTWGEKICVFCSCKYEMSQYTLLVLLSIFWGSIFQSCHNEHCHISTKILFLFQL